MGVVFFPPNPKKNEPAKRNKIWEPKKPHDPLLVINHTANLSCLSLEVWADSKLDSLDPVDTRPKMHSNSGLASLWMWHLRCGLQRISLFSKLILPLLRQNLRRSNWSFIETLPGNCPPSSDWKVLPMNCKILLWVKALGSLFSTARPPPCSLSWRVWGVPYGIRVSDPHTYHLRIYSPSDRYPNEQPPFVLFGQDTSTARALPLNLKHPSKNSSRGIVPPPSLAGLCEVLLLFQTLFSKTTCSFDFSRWAVQPSLHVQHLEEGPCIPNVLRTANQSRSTNQLAIKHHRSS